MNDLERFIYQYYILGEIIRLKMLIFLLKAQSFFKNIKISYMKKRLLIKCYFAYKNGKISLQEYNNYKIKFK
jgi:hypothetical protein